MAVLQKKVTLTLLQSTYSHMESENTAAYCGNKDTRYLMQEWCKCGHTTKWSSYKSFIWGGIPVLGKCSFETACSKIVSWSRSSNTLKKKKKFQKSRSNKTELDALLYPSFEGKKVWKNVTRVKEYLYARFHKHTKMDFHFDQISVFIRKQYQGYFLSNVCPWAAAEEQ